MPHGNDNSVDHAVCIIDDLIFNSTQAFAMKLKKESFDWICGDLGCNEEPFGVLRFNQSHTQTMSYKHQMKMHW